MCPAGRSPGGGQAPALQPHTGPLYRKTNLVPEHSWAAWARAVAPTVAIILTADVCLRADATGAERE
jgi:hypothetical protein